MPFRRSPGPRRGRASGSFGVNYYANTSKLTAISSATGIESTNGTTYGNAASGGYYAAIAPGVYTVTGKIAATVDKDLTITTVPATLADGKSYTVYTSGFYDAVAKTVDGFIVEDPYIGFIDYTVAYVRFVHASSNAAPLTLYAKNTVTLVEGAVGAEQVYKSAGVFIPMAAGAYDLGARYAGVGTNAISRTAQSFLAGRVYTITARGDITVLGGAATNRPQLDNSANR